MTGRGKKWSIEDLRTVRVMEHYEMHAPDGSVVISGDTLSELEDELAILIAAEDE